MLGPLVSVSKDRNLKEQLHSRSVVVTNFLFIIERSYNKKLVKLAQKL